ncbi:MAG: hypothetical protein REI78_15060 [Pedobacter sp.]|nr:hypothetical protein [Pedobacter sp.]MDQ8054349.1 hypothetical protein [Pedobacter sp.]
MKFKFIDYYALASNLVFATFLIGIAIIFIRGLDEVADLIISAVILSLRYFSVVLIRRRFEFGKYLLLILIARNIYRLIHAPAIPNTLATYLIIAQIILTGIAFILISRAPQRMLDELRKKIHHKMEEKKDPTL